MLSLNDPSCSLGVLVALLPVKMENSYYIPLCDRQRCMFEDEYVSPQYPLLHDS